MSPLPKKFNDVIIHNNDHRVENIDLLEVENGLIPDRGFSRIILYNAGIKGCYIYEGYYDLPEYIQLYIGTTIKDIQLCPR
ncbi:MAG: hypothetical protein HAW67_04655 [Endozoicomonadaceae bacterium]|nr:hypothetical protein [Endozoicomonadaceae bacterium]